jgi:hypothetical protein
MRLSVLATLLLVIQTMAHSQSTDAVANRILKGADARRAAQLYLPRNRGALGYSQNGKRTLQDHVRLEVALVDGKEMLSWPVLSMLAEEQITGSNVTRLDFSVPAEYSGLTGNQNQSKESSGYHDRLYIDRPV